MYADKETEAMRTAIGETDRRRAIQRAYNERARHHAGDDRQGHLGHHGVPDVGLQGPDQGPPPAREEAST